MDGGRALSRGGRTAKIAAMATPAGDGSRAAWARGIGAALLVGLAGRLATGEVFGLAIASAFAFASLGRREAREGRAQGPDWLGWLMQLAFLAILCAAAWDNRLPRPASTSAASVAVPLAGFALLAAGLELRRRTERAMGRLFTVQLLVGERHRLVTDGPFRRIRHPSYASLGAIALGTALAVRSPSAVIATLVIWLPVILLRIHQEEAALSRRLGTAYREYAERTWRLVPGVY